MGRNSFAYRIETNKNEIGLLFRNSARREWSKIFEMLKEKYISLDFGI